MPCYQCREELKDGDEEAETDEEIPISPLHAKDLKGYDLHPGDHCVNAPLRIDLAEAHCMPDREEDEEDGGDPIEQGGAHRSSSGG